MWKFHKKTVIFDRPDTRRTKNPKRKNYNQKKKIEKRFKKMGIVASLAAIPIGEDIIR